MLTIRMQRTGRKGHAMFRVVVQDARRTPTSGKVVALLGHYDPHAKTVTINKEKASFYLDHGAQPSDRVARLLKSEKVTLPKWVELEGKRAGKLRNPDKLRRNRPATAEPVEETKVEDAVTEPTTTEEAVETPTEITDEPVAESPAEPADTPDDQA